MTPATLTPEAAEAVVNLLLQNLDGKTALSLLRRTAERIGLNVDPDMAFERVRLRSIGAEQELLAEEGGSVSDSALSKLLRVRSRQTVHNYRRDGKLLAIPRGERNMLYPAWQVHKGELLTGLAAILKTLAERKHSPVDQMLFFLTPAEALDGERPLDLLRRGEVEEVALHAERYGIIGA